MDPETGYFNQCIHEYVEAWKTVHLAHFLSAPMHYAAAVGHHTPSVEDVVSENVVVTTGSSVHTAHALDVCEELAKTMCNSLFLGNSYMPSHAHDQVMTSVKARLNSYDPDELDTVDAIEILDRVQKTTEATLKHLTLDLEMNMMILYVVTHAVINRSHDERMGQWQCKQLLDCGVDWTWGHHEHLVWVKSNLQMPGSYSVRSPVDLMRLLGNVDRHLCRFYLHVTPLKALLDMFPELHCLTASLLPYLESDQIGVSDSQRELASRYLAACPNWRDFFKAD